MLYRIQRDLVLCINCGKCNGYWQGITARFNGKGFFDLDKKEFMFRQHSFEWAKNLCSEDAISLVMAHDEEDIETAAEEMQSADA